MPDVALRLPEVGAFWRKVAQFNSDDCWPWTARIEWDGYGRFGVIRGVRGSPINMRAHRVAYALVIGPIPPGAKLDHVCHNADAACPGGPSCQHRRCCNPGHLEPVTSRVNVLRGRGVTAINAARTECVDGHPFSVENTYMTPNGRRMCKQCQRRREAEQYARRKATARA